MNKARRKTVVIETQQLRGGFRVIVRSAACDGFSDARHWDDALRAAIANWRRERARRAD